MDLTSTAVPPRRWIGELRSDDNPLDWREMASVKKALHGNLWNACFRMPTGALDSRGRPAYRRVEKPTGVSDRSRALQLAVSYERAALFAAEKQWSEEAAQRFLAEVRTLAGAPNAQPREIEEFLDSWLVLRKQTAAPKSLLNTQSVLNDFLRWLGPRRSASVHQLTASDVAAFRDAELAAGKSASTVNKALSFLSQAFEEAIAQGLMEKNYARGLRIKGARKTGQRRRPFTFEQFSELVRRTAPEECGTRGGPTHPEWQTFIVVSGYTGGRQQEVAQLTWGRVDFAQKRIGLLRTKNGGDVHWVPMHESLHSHLRARAESNPVRTAEDFVLPGFAAAEGRYLSKAFRELILPRIGLRQPYVKRGVSTGTGRKLASYSIHSLRHSLPTWLNAAGVTDVMRMRIVGHDDEEVSRGYTHTDMEHARSELAKLPSLASPALKAAAPENGDSSG